MKLGFLILTLLSPFSAFAEGNVSCNVAAPSEPNRFTNELVHVYPALGETRYVLVNKNFTAAEEISRDDYFKRKAEKFAGIEGQAVVLFQHDSEDYVGITYGYTDGAQGKLVNGATAFGGLGEHHAVVFPLDRNFAAGCKRKKN